MRIAWILLGMYSVVLVNSTLYFNWHIWWMYRIILTLLCKSEYCPPYECSFRKFCRLFSQVSTNLDWLCDRNCSFFSPLVYIHRCALTDNWLNFACKENQFLEEKSQFSEREEEMSNGENKIVLQNHRNCMASNLRVLSIYLVMFHSHAKWQEFYVPIQFKWEWSLKQKYTLMKSIRNKHKLFKLN